MIREGQEDLTPDGHIKNRNSLWTDEYLRTNAVKRARDLWFEFFAAMHTTRRDVFPPDCESQEYYFHVSALTSPPLTTSAGPQSHHPRRRLCVSGVRCGSIYELCRQRALSQLHRHVVDRIPHAVLRPPRRKDPRCSIRESNSAQVIALPVRGSS